MAKVVAEKTKQLSVRIDDAERERIDGIREVLKERNGVLPQRSDIVRNCLKLGVNAYIDEYEIDLTPVAVPVSPTPAPPPPSASPVPKRTSARGSVRVTNSGHKGGGGKKSGKAAAA